MSTDRQPGRRWAYAGAFLGGAVSIAANVGHSYVPPEDAAESWTPHAGAVALAVFWPVALLFAVEILARTQWPDALRWAFLRYGGMVPVGLVAAVVSYRHMAGLLDWYGEDPLTTAIGPLAVDGLMVMATGALIAMGRRTTVPAVVPHAAVPVVRETVAVDEQETATGDQHPPSVTDDPGDRPETTATVREDGPPETTPAPSARTTPRTVRRTTKVQPIDAATDHRVDRVAKAYPDTIPTLGAIKEVLGLKSQSTAITVRDRLKARRETATKERSA